MGLLVHATLVLFRQGQLMVLGETSQAAKAAFLLFPASYPAYSRGMFSCNKGKPRAPSNLAGRILQWNATRSRAARQPRTEPAGKAAHRREEFAPHHLLRSLDLVGFIMPLRSSHHSRWRAMWQKTHDGAISHLPEDKWVNAAVERAMADGDVDLRG